MKKKGEEAVKAKIEISGKLRDVGEIFEKVIL